MRVERRLEARNHDPWVRLQLQRAALPRPRQLQQAAAVVGELEHRRELPVLDRCSRQSLGIDRPAGEEHEVAV
ncbi:MAG: hypothetical protein MUE78_06550, partial [Ilumatobacteraceae bacterium]|nr:hypothetical protein [Ilumatobacteraceae bacterium]